MLRNKWGDSDSEETEVPPVTNQVPQRPHYYPQSPRDPQGPPGYATAEAQGTNRSPYVGGGRYV